MRGSRPHIQSPKKKFGFVRLHSSSFHFSSSKKLSSRCQHYLPRGHANRCTVKMQKFFDKALAPVNPAAIPIHVSQLLTINVIMSTRLFRCKT